MANNVLDMLGRAVLRIGGMSPQQIRQQTRANRASKPMPKANTSRPAPAPAPVTRRSRVNGRVVSGPDTRGNRPIPPSKPPAPPAPGSIQPKGQTNLFSQNGNPRNFTNPATSANRPPTLSPVPQRGGQATPPNPPAGGFGGAAAPGQMSLFGANPGAKPGGNFKAPSVPNAGDGIRQFSQGAKDWLNSRSTGAATQRALASTNSSKLMSGLGKSAGIVGVVAAMADEINEIKERDKTFSWNRSKKTEAAPQQGNYQSQFAGKRDENINRINNDPRFAAPAPAAVQPVQRRSPAIGAPVHASPAAFGSAPKLAQSSAYVGSSAASPARPSTPAQAVQQQPQAPANPYAGIGDVRGQQLPQSPVQQDAELSAGSQQYGGQSVQGINENGVDMERRRAFLDANNSLDGLKAVKELLNRRKLSISVEN